MMINWAEASMILGGFIVILGFLIRLEHRLTCVETKVKVLYNGRE